MRRRVPHTLSGIEPANPEVFALMKLTDCLPALRLLAAGRTYDETARELSTTKVHLVNIVRRAMRGLGCRSVRTLFARLHLGGIVNVPGAEVLQ